MKSNTKSVTRSISPRTTTPKAEFRDAYQVAKANKRQEEQAEFKTLLGQMRCVYHYSAPHYSEAMGFMKGKLAILSAGEEGLRHDPISWEESAMFWSRALELHREGIFLNCDYPNDTNPMEEWLHRASTSHLVEEIAGANAY